MANRTLELTDTLYAYLVEASLREDNLLRRLRTETAQLADANMQISPEQGQFMGLLVELMGARKALEIGTFTGYSALCVARSLPVDGTLLACDLSEEWTSMARRYWAEAGVAHKIDLRLGSALETLASLPEVEKETFDFAFIDADKVTYPEYYDACLSLLRPGGLIAIDNTLRDGKVADPSNQEPETVAIRKLNLRIREDDRVTCSLVPIGDGVLLARKR